MKTIYEYCTEVLVKRHAVPASEQMFVEAIVTALLDNAKTNNEPHFQKLTRDELYDTFADAVIVAMRATGWYLRGASE